MNTASTCLMFLVCTVLCISAAPVIKKCRCLRGSKAVNFNLLADIVEYEPRPYCNMREVIATLKSGTQQCLNPQKFTRTAVAHLRKELAKQSAAASSKRTQTTTASISTSAIALATASASTAAM